MVDHIKHLVECMFRHVGHTVTIFTTSGGLSGNGFTGVLLSIDHNCVRLLADIGAPPSCPLGSACCEGFRNDEDFCAGNPLGAIVVIPTCSIAAFTHNTI